MMRRPAFGITVCRALRAVMKERNSTARSAEVGVMISNADWGGFRVI